jgi:hypothetical protein
MHSFVKASDVPDLQFKSFKVMYTNRSSESMEVLQGLFNVFFWGGGGEGEYKITAYRLCKDLI